MAPYKGFRMVSIITIRIYLPLQSGIDYLHVDRSLYSCMLSVRGLPILIKAYSL